MFFKYDQIKNLISKMTEDSVKNLEIIKEEIEDINIIDDYGRTLLHAFVDGDFFQNEEKVVYAIRTLLEAGINPNMVNLEDENFVFLALKYKCSDVFVFNIIKESIKYGFDVNSVDKYNSTIMHALIYNDLYEDEITSIYELLCENGFNSAIEDEGCGTIYDALLQEKMLCDEANFVQAKTRDEEIIKFELIYNNEMSRIENRAIRDMFSNDISFDSKEEKLTSGEINLLCKHGDILNQKKYIQAPTIGREKEIERLMISLAMNKKSVLIVGDSGVGKTAIAEELVYRIKSGNVPNFLKEKVIYEISANGMVAGSRYVGDLEKKMKEILDICSKREIIVFIDEIHTIYGAGKSEGNDNDMASILRFYIDRKGLKVIGTTTDYEYDKYFSESSLKRRFEKVVIQEAKEEILKQIAEKMILDYSDNTNISCTLLLEEYPQLIDLLIKFTRKNYRHYKDKVNNPDLMQMIIDKAFAYARYSDARELEIEHFKKGFEEDRLYPIAQKEAIQALEKLQPTKKEMAKILRIDFNKRV